MLFDQGQLVYVGETGKISGRALDMLDSRHHTVRGSIGEMLFSNLEGYQKVSSKTKHPPHIEDLVQSKMLELYICAKPLKIGRKEFEEYISGKHTPTFNRSMKRA